MDIQVPTYISEKIHYEEPFNPQKYHLIRDLIAPVITSLLTVQSTKKNSCIHTKNPTCEAKIVPKRVASRLEDDRVVVDDEAWAFGLIRFRGEIRSGVGGSLTFRAGESKIVRSPEKNCLFHRIGG